MKTYTLQDGGKITAATPSSFVTQLREGSRFDSEGTDADFMGRFADRYKTYSGITIATHSPEAFVADLLAAGYIREV